MESNWRTNVILYGLQDDGIDMCARVSGVPFARFLICKSVVPGFYRFIVTLVPAQFPSLVDELRPIPEGLNFPYGFAVEPD